MSRKSNNIDEWWAEGKAEGKADAQVTGKRTRKPKKFDDNESSRRRLNPKARRSQAKARNPQPTNPTPIRKHLLCLLYPNFRPSKTAIPLILFALPLIAN
jgi:hypothetical protein